MRIGRGGAAWIVAILVVGSLAVGSVMGEPGAARAQTGLQGTLVRPEPVEPIASQLGRPSETGGPAELRARQQALLDRTRRDPLDFETTYDYVDISIALRDNEAAIGALERLLNYNPGLARARYELASLYYQMGSYDAASHYLATLAGNPSLDPVVQSRVDALYPDVVKGQSQSRWSGFLQAGLRFQSNANFVPAGGILRLGGQDFVLTPQARRRSDGSAFGLLQIGHDYDLLNQRGDVLETRFQAFGSKQFRETAFDFGYLEASFGPRFGLPELMDGASIKPYVVGQTSALRAERAPYISSGGGGVTMRLPITPSLTLDPGIEGRAVGVSGRDSFGAASLGTGTAIAGYLTATLTVVPDIVVEARFIGIRSDADRPGQGFTRGGAAVAVSFQFDPPSELIARKWKLSPFVGGAYSGFDRANPAVSPTVVRADREFNAGVVLDAPLTGVLGLSALVQYDRIDSNLPNYRQNGLTVLGGPTARF